MPGKEESEREGNDDRRYIKNMAIEDVISTGKCHSLRNNFLLGIPRAGPRRERKPGPRAICWRREREGEREREGGRESNTNMEKSFGDSQSLRPAARLKKPGEREAK